MVDGAARQGTRTELAWPVVLTTLLSGGHLSEDEAGWAMSRVMAGDATPAQVAAFAVALRAKGETSAEVSALAQVMLDSSTPLEVAGVTVDTCGTGGDRAHTVNISTMAAVVVRAAGATVVKHGNRAASSACGSADLLEALGVAIDLPPAAVGRCVEAAGICFCFAPVFHPALRHAAVARREIGVPTVFNFLGPLTNPARPKAQAVGVADPRMAPVLAGVLARRGVSALVFRGDDGLDELTTVTTSQVWVVAGGEVRRQTLDPRALGIAPADPADLRGGDAAANAEVARRVLGGAPGPVRDAVLLNAAAGLAAVRAATDPATADRPLPERLHAAFDEAAEAVDSGAAARVLVSWAEASRTAAGAGSADLRR